MQDDNDLIQQRRKNLAAIKELGINPYGGRLEGLCAAKDAERVKKMVERVPEDLR